MIFLLVCVINRVLGVHLFVVGLESCLHGLLVVRREWHEPEDGGDESSRRPWRPWWRRVIACENFGTELILLLRSGRTKMIGRPLGLRLGRKGRRWLW